MSLSFIVNSLKSIQDNITLKSSSHIIVIQKIEKESLITIEVARSVIDIASDGQASDIVLIDISKVSDVCDYLIIMTADNPVQIGNLAKNFKTMGGQLGFPIHRIEGQLNSGWVLLDFGSFITHIFNEEQRTRYDLDELWSQGIPLVRIH